MSIIINNIDKDIYSFAPKMQFNTYLKQDLCSIHRLITTHITECDKFTANVKY